MTKILFKQIIYSIAVISLAASGFCQNQSGPTGQFIKPFPSPTPPKPTPTPTPTPIPTPTPGQSGVSIMAAAMNQRGMGSRTSAAIRAGGAANVMGSRSYTYSVPMFSLPGRHGLNLNLALYYNSLVWESVLGTGVTFNQETSSAGTGFRLDYGYIAWNISMGSWSGVLIDATGAKHALVASTQFGAQFNTVDSSYISVQHHTATSSTDIDSDLVTYKNGMQVSYLQAPGSVVSCCSGSIVSGSSFITRPVKIEDTSGNFLTLTYADNSTVNISSIVDTIGRTINFVYNNNLLSCVTDAAVCNAAGSRTFNFSWNTNYILNYQFTNYVTEWPSVIPPLQGSTIPYSVLAAVTRPDGTKVQFNYGDWLIVNDIQELSNNGSLRYETNYNFPLASAGPLSDPPTYTQQTVTTFDKDGNAKHAVWLYQAVMSNPTPSEKIVSCFAITDPVGTIHMTTISAQGNIFDGLPVKTTTATGSTAPCTNTPTTILRSVSTQWTTDTDSSGALTGANPRPQTVTTILADSTTQSQTQIAYDVHGNRSDVKQFDFGSGKPGPLLREVITMFASNLGNIFDRPTDIQVKDGGGNLLRHESFAYDNYTLTPLQSVAPLPPGFDNSGTFSPGSATPRGNLTSSTVYSNAAAGTGAINTTFTYDMFGNLVALNSGCCTQAAAAYSIGTQYSLPDSVSVGPPGSQLTTGFTYSLNNGRLATVTAVDGHKTQLNYDMDARLLNASTPDGIIATYSYDDVSQNPGFSVSNTADNLVIKTVNDSRGRPLTRQILNGSSIVSTTAYVNDALGRAVQISNPYAPSDVIFNTTLAFDALGRQTSSTPPALAGAAQNSYTKGYGTSTFTDAAGGTHTGTTLQRIDPAGHSRLEYRNALGFLLRVDELNPLPGTAAYSTYYSYDALGDILQVIQGQQTRTYGYDSIGRKVSECLPEMANKCRTFTYTDFNAVKTMTDPRGIITTYGFDLLNRVNDIQYSDGTPELKFSYGGAGSPNNGAGRIVSSSDGVGLTTYQYDAMGRATQISQIIGGKTFTTKLGYTNGRLASITYPSGAAGTGTQATYTYGGIGRLSSVLSGTTTVYSVKSYGAAGQPLSSDFGNGISGTYTYNNQLQLDTIQYGNLASQIMNITYGYGGAIDNGQIQGVTDNLDSTHSTAYSYDGLGRLQQAQTVDQASASSWNLMFAYDRYGNRISQTPMGGLASMPSSQLLIDPATNHIISTGMAYDAAGNMTSDSAFNYAFDAANRVTSVSVPGVLTPIATYGYDFAGHRAIKNGRVYIYIGGRVIAEYSAGANPSSPDVEYIYAGSRRIATLSAGAMTYQYWDHLSVRTNADASGKVIRTYGSFPFGETWYEKGVVDKWKFTTYEHDAETGLNYAGARFHSPALGRFMSLDTFAGNPSNPQSLNRYAYVGNNPINSTDSTGMFCDMDCDDDGGGGGGGAEGGAGTPCGPFECSGDSEPDPTPDPDPNDLPDAPEPKPDVLQNNNASADLDFVFNGGNAGTDLTGTSASDLSSLLPTVQNGTQESNGSSSGGDVAPGIDIWHDSAQCQGCGALWRESSTWGNRIFAGTAIVAGGVPLAAEGVLVAANLAAQATGWIAGASGTAGVVLGKFAQDPDEVIGYLEQAKAYGMNAFNISKGLFNVFDRMGVAWTANQAFLDASINRGQQFFISSTEITGYYWMEIQYLASRGIGFDQLKGLFIEY